MADTRFSFSSLLRPWQIARGRLAPLLNRRRPQQSATAGVTEGMAPPEPVQVPADGTVAGAQAAPMVASFTTAEVAGPSRLWAEVAAPQWLRVGWDLSSADRDRCQQAQFRLALRLTDQATAVSPNPQAVMELMVDAGTSGWELPVPLGGRSYRIALGLRSDSGLWQELAAAEGVWVEPAIAAPPQPEPLSFPEPVIATGEVPSLPGSSSWSAGQPHEQSYQRATTSWRRLGLGSESIQLGESADLGSSLPGSSRDSGAGLWASGRDSGSGGVSPRQRRFWLVADAELIVYGATDPAASLRIGETSVPLSEAGTFRIHVPFADGEQTYPIRATAADGEQHRHVQLDFSRNTPERNTNTGGEANDEWF